MSEIPRLAKPCDSSDSVSDLSSLLAATARADRKAFKRLYELTHRKLFGIALLMLKRRDAAEDVLQEAYLRVWMRAGTFDPNKGTPLAWLGRIVRNVAVDRIRRYEAPLENIDAHIDAVVVEPVPVPELQELRRSLLILAPMQRQALLLTHFQGLSREEVAERLNVPVGTIKSWVFRVSERIKQTIEA